MKKLHDQLIELLKQDERLWADKRLLKNQVVELGLKLDPDLLKLLLTHNSLKKHFFVDVDGVMVFDKDKFIRFVNNKAFLPDSYTSFKNKIGLTVNGHYLSESRDVVLVWPYKDCVLEGGQTKEDQKRDEIFWNEILAPDEIDRLLAPKVLTGFNRYDTEGEHEVTELEDTDNLIIKGNNLLTLHSLKKRFAGKVKLIYIDPPYNTGNDSFQYNDRFNHSSWLSFMKIRLEIAKYLLSENGSIWINIDDDESHYLKVLMDEIFGRKNFVSNIVWEKKFSPQNDAKWISDTHDHILVFAKNKSVWRPNLLPRTKAMNRRYKNRDNDTRGRWMSSGLDVKTYSSKYDYEIITPSGRKVLPPKGACWRVSKEKLDELIKDNRIWFGKKGTNVPRLKRFLSEVTDGRTPVSIWPHKEVGHNQEARQETNNLIGTKVFKTPKPERLLQRILTIASDECDIVLDYFIGSGTTAAVAHKMGRQYIGVEQMDYIETITVERLKKVIGKNVKPKGTLLEELEYDRGGISEDVEWRGGGDFVYCELMQWNERFIQQIQAAQDKAALQSIWTEMQEDGFLSYRLDISLFDEHAQEFSDLSLDAQKEFLLEVLDKNQLYVNFSEIDDETHNISEEDKRLNKLFYKR